MEYLSLNGMKEVFSQWATNDPNIQQFGYGQPFKENGEIKINQKYPGMWVTYNKSDIPANGYANFRTYQIMFYDIAHDDTQVDNAQSDMEEIAYRLIRFLRNNSEVFGLSNNPTFVPMEDRFLDAVAGVIVDVTLEFNGESSQCMDPDNNFTIKYNTI